MLVFMWIERCSVERREISFAHALDVECGKTSHIIDKSLLSIFVFISAAVKYFRRSDEIIRNETLSIKYWICVSVCVSIPA